MQSLTIAMVLQVGRGWVPLVIMVSVNTMFLFSIWEQSYTTVLNFHPLAGPTEALTLCIVLMLAAAVMDPVFWNDNLWFGRGGMRVSVAGIPVTIVNLFAVFTAISVIHVVFQGFGTSLILMLFFSRPHPSRDSPMLTLFFSRILRHLFLIFLKRQAHAR